MYDMNFRISTKRAEKTIVDTATPRFSVIPLVSIVVESAIQNLSDFATITLVGFVMNEPIGLEKVFKVGDRIKLEFGYDNILNNEFEGFIDKTSYNGDDFVINCIDALYLYKKTVKSIEFKNKNIRQILEYVSKEVNSNFKVVTDVEMIYEKFVIHNATGYDVLKKIADETKLNIYFLTKKDELHVHPAFIEKTGEVIYSMQDNIESYDLTYILKEESKLKVIIEATDLKGKSYHFEKGNSSEEKDIYKMKVDGISPAQAKELLDLTYDTRYRDRYEGSLTGWLIPYCCSGYSAKIIDSDFPNQTSIHYVESVTSEFSEDSGGKRTVKLGFRIG